jgi:hypothetical protein
MDSAYYAAAAVVVGIPEDAWQAIAYPQAVWNDQLGCWVSDADHGGP